MIIHALLQTSLLFHFYMGLTACAFCLAMLCMHEKSRSWSQKMEVLIMILTKSLGAYINDCEWTWTNCASVDALFISFP